MNDNAEYINYLNTLHTASGKGSNSNIEGQQSNTFFIKTKVKMDIEEKLIEFLEGEPQFIILTGHAGDGKTSILLNVLRDMKCIGEDEGLDKIGRIEKADGKKIIYIKDLSELTTEDRNAEFRRCFEEIDRGNHAIVVGNTGPLLRCFKELFGSNAQEELINALDDNRGDIKTIGGHAIRSINVAKLDNAGFAKKYIDNITKEQMWEKCSACEKNDKCPMYFNYTLIRENGKKITDFITNHYIWQQEHGKRLTIRKMTAHIAYMITGGIGCNKVKKTYNSKSMLRRILCNNFFGYYGNVVNKDALQIQAIADIRDNRYDEKRLSIDEKIYIEEDYSIFPDSIRGLIREIDKSDKLEVQREIKRMYIMLNVETDEDINNSVLDDLFSPQFKNFLKFRNGENVSKAQKNEIVDSIGKLLFGDCAKSEISVTMQRENSFIQNVKLLLGRIKTKDLKIENTCEENFDISTLKRYKLFLTIKNSEVRYPLDLPLLNYLHEIRNGIVNTKVDPQLTHGVDNLKTELQAYVLEEDEEDSITFVAMTSSGYKEFEIEYDNGKWQKS